MTRLRSNNSHVCLLVRQAFHNCTCVGEMMTPGVNMSTVLGQCSRKSDCDRIFKIYMALSVLGSFISACGGTPGYMVLLRSVIIRHSVQASRQLTGILFLNTCADLPGPFSRTWRPWLWGCRRWSWELWVSFDACFVNSACCKLWHNVVSLLLKVFFRTQGNCACIKSSVYVFFLFVFLGGIPPPIYFGALIDRTCLKWGTKQCGGRGACRLYDSNAFRYSKNTLLLISKLTYISE